MSVRVAVVAEYYPGRQDPALGIWAHRQAVAAREAGADVRVLVLHRPLPTRAALRAAGPAALMAPLREPVHTVIDGVPITRIPFLAPPRPQTYGTWGAWAAPSLLLGLKWLRRTFDFDLVHAHYAAPPADAVLRAGVKRPLVVSVHGGDVLGVVSGWPRTGARAVRRSLREARLVLANSAGIERRCHDLGATSTRVVHLGTDLPAEIAAPPADPVLVTVANLVERKRHSDVLTAFARLRHGYPGLRWEIVGDGPQREALERQAEEFGCRDAVDFRGACEPRDAVRIARAATVFVLPSVDEAFGVAYIEAMAGGVPTLGCHGEHGPEEITSCGEGMLLVSPRRPEAIEHELRRLLIDHDERARLSRAARATVENCFTWEECGRQTVAAYKAALA